MDASAKSQSTSSPGQRLDVLATGMAKSRPSILMPGMMGGRKWVGGQAGEGMGLGCTGSLFREPSRRVAGGKGGCLGVWMEVCRQHLGQED